MPLMGGMVGADGLTAQGVLLQAVSENNFSYFHFQMCKKNRSFLPFLGPERSFERC